MSRPGSTTGSGSASRGQGTPASPAPRGDLYVEVEVGEDERFQREGKTLSRVAIPATEAMLGGTVKSRRLDGEREVEVPAGTQPGTE